VKGPEEITRRLELAKRSPAAPKSEADLVAQLRRRVEALENLTRIQDERLKTLETWLGQLTNERH